MPKTLTMLSGFLVASFIVTGLINARDIIEQSKVHYPLSDAQVVITSFTDIESICEPTEVLYQLNNTSTVGGGPVPMVGAQLEARFPKRNWFGVEVGDIVIDKGNVTIGEDGDDYVITNLIGDVAPNDIFNMRIRLGNSRFIRYADFMGEVRSNTFDPNPANNAAEIMSEFNFLPPLSFIFGGFDNVIEMPPDFEPTTKLPQFQVVDPTHPFAFEMSMLFDDDACANQPVDRQFEFQDGSLVAWFRDLADKVDDVEITNPSSPVEITTEGNDLKATFDLGTFSYGDELQFGLNMKLNADYSGTYEYSTEFTADNIDDDVDIFAGTGTITILERALPDLKIWKLADQPDSTNIPMLDTLKYTVKVTNIGDASAQNVVVKDTIPNPQFTLYSAWSNRAPCNAVGPAVSCDVGEVTPGDTVSVEIRVIANFPGAAINRAHVISTSEEVTIENNISNEVIHFPVTAERRADLHVEIVSSIPDSMRIDGIFSQHVVVVNRGPNDAQRATLTINYSSPVQVKFLGHTPPGNITCQKPNPSQFILALTCEVTDLPVKGFVTLRVVGVADVALFGGFTTSAEVMPISPQDPELDNNVAEVATAVKLGAPGWPENPLPQPPIGVPVPNPDQTWADLELTKALLLPPPNPFAPPYTVGSNIFYRYTVRNNGKNVAQNVKFSDMFIGHPNFKNYLHGSLPVAMQPICSINDLFIFHSLDCALGNMAPGESITFGITAEAVDSVGINLINTAFVTSVTPDPNLANNSMSNMVRIYKLPTVPLYATDLSFAYAEPNENRQTSEDTLRTIVTTVTNISNVPAMHATYTDTLPAALRFLGMRYTGSEEDHPFCYADRIEHSGTDRDRIVCQWSSILAGESFSVELDVAIKQLGHLDLRGHVRSSNYDKDLTNNLDSLRLVNPMGTSLDDPDRELPTTTQLHQNYPNPFNPSTVISFELRQGSEVVLDVFSVDGRRVIGVISGSLPAGIHRVELDASRLSSGVYIYRLITPDGRFQRKMTLVK